LKTKGLLFIGNIVPFTVGYGLLPLLPVYASQLGATPLLIGYYLSFAYLALTLGTIFAGNLSDRIRSHKTLLIVSSIVMIPGIWSMGQCRTLWQLAIASAVVWFFGGMVIVVISILIARSAAENMKGRMFGILGLTRAVAFLIGGLASGAIVDRWGYPAMFTVFAVFSFILPLSSVFVRDTREEGVKTSKPLTKDSKIELGTSIILLFIATILVRIAAFLGDMGRSLSMKELGFTSSAISSTAAVIGIVLLPLPFLLGWLSDRYQRKWVVALCYLASASALCVLIFARLLWHFWLYAALMAVLSAGNSVGAAYVTDIVSKKSLGFGMSLFRSAGWIGGIVGFALAGNAIQKYGMKVPLIISLFLPLLGITLLLSIRKAKIHA
jgi:MFS family permease